MGAATAVAISFITDVIGTIAGSKGLAIVLSSDTPSSKGRTVTEASKVLNKSPSKTAVGAEPKTTDSDMTATVTASNDQRTPGLPPAPSEFHSYLDKSSNCALLMADFKKIMNLGSVVEGSELAVIVSGQINSGAQPGDLCDRTDVKLKR